MGSGPFVVAFIVVLVAVIWIVLGPKYLYCEDCQIIPDKRSELDVAFEDACTELRVRHGCSLLSMQDVKRLYAEIGQTARLYTVTELCNLKNPYYALHQCAALCGCNVAGGEGI